MLKLGLTLLSVTTALGLVHSPRQEDASRYTVCGGDRGYTERDSLLAAARLENKIVTSDKFAMEKDDCIFAHVNTTIVSLCNGNYRSRNINRAEGMSQSSSNSNSAFTNHNRFVQFAVVSTNSFKTAVSRVASLVSTSSTI